MTMICNIGCASSPEQVTSNTSSDDPHESGGDGINWLRVANFDLLKASCSLFFYPNIS